MNAFAQERQAVGEHYVYVFSAGDDWLLGEAAHMKIGVANDIEYRLKGCQTGNPLRLELMGYLITEGPATSRYYERMLLSSPCLEKAHGEWVRARPSNMIKTFREIRPKGRLWLNPTFMEAAQPEDGLSDNDWRQWYDGLNNGIAGPFMGLDAEKWELRCGGYQPYWTKTSQ